MNKNDNLKIIAVVSMLIDHIGYFFYPNQIIFRIIGRLAFLLFAQQLAQGYLVTSNVKNYIIRLLLFALISQPIYALAFDNGKLNILFTLLLGLILIALKSSIFKQIIFFILIIVLNYYIKIDYSIYGVLVVYLFSYQDLLRNHKYILYSILLIMVITHIFFTYKILHIFALLVIPLFYIFKKPVKYNINKYWFYLFYPGHILLILIIKFIISR